LTFNRILVIVAAVVVLAGALITLLVASGATSANVLPYDWFHSALQRAADATGGSRAGVLAVTSVLLMGMIGLLYFELARYHRPGLLIVKSTDEGTTAIDYESVRVLAEKAAATARNVREVKCGVSGAADGLVISCRSTVAMGSNIPEVNADIQQRTKEAVEGTIGLPVAFVDVKTKYEIADVKRPPVR